MPICQKILFSKFNCAMCIASGSWLLTSRKVSSVVPDSHVSKSSSRVSREVEVLGRKIGGVAPLLRYSAYPFEEAGLSQSLKSRSCLPTLPSIMPATTMASPIRMKITRAPITTPQIAPTWAAISAI